MADVECPFCAAEGWATENNGAEFQNVDGTVTPLWGIDFPEHYGACPFIGRYSYRCDYMSKQEAIDAHVVVGVKLDVKGTDADT